MSRNIKKNKLNANEKNILKFFQERIQCLKILNIQKIYNRHWVYVKRGVLCKKLKLSTDKVRYAIENLQKKDILLTAKFIKTGWDNTLWYAFVNEKKYLKSKKF